MDRNYKHHDANVMHMCINNYIADPQKKIISVYDTVGSYLINRNAFSYAEHVNILDTINKAALVELSRHNPAPEWILVLPVSDIHRFMVDIRTDCDVYKCFKYIWTRVINTDLSKDIYHICVLLEYLFNMYPLELIESFNSNYCHVYDNDMAIHPVHMFRMIIGSILRYSEFTVDYSEDIASDNLEIRGDNMFFEYVIQT